MFPLEPDLLTLRWLSWNRSLAPRESKQFFIYNKDRLVCWFLYLYHHSIFDAWLESDTVLWWMLEFILSLGVCKERYTSLEHQVGQPHRPHQAVLSQISRAPRIARRHMPLPWHCPEITLHLCRHKQGLVPWPGSQIIFFWRAALTHPHSSLGILSSGLPKSNTLIGMLSVIFLAKPPLCRRILSCCFGAVSFGVCQLLEARFMTTPPPLVTFWTLCDFFHTWRWHHVTSSATDYQLAVRGCLFTSRTPWEKSFIGPLQFTNHSWPGDCRAQFKSWVLCYAS